MAVKHKIANTEVCGAVLEYLRDKKKPENVNHIWKIVNEQNIPLSIGILEVVFDTYADAGDVCDFSCFHLSPPFLSSFNGKKETQAMWKLVPKQNILLLEFWKFGIHFSIFFFLYKNSNN